VAHAGDLENGHAGNMAPGSAPVKAGPVKAGAAEVGILSRSARTGGEKA